MASVVARIEQHPWLHPTDKDRLLFKTLTESAVAGVKITTLILRTCKFLTIACGWWSLVTN